MTAQTLPTTTPAQVPVARRRFRRRGGGEDRTSWGTTIILALCTLAVLAPLYATATMAFKTTSQSVDGQVFSLPSPVSVDGFVEAWRLTNFPRGFAISVFVTAVTVVGTVALASLAAYAIARNWDRRFFRWSFFYLLAAMFLPFPVLALSQVKLTGIVGLANPVGVALLHVMFQLSFSVLLFTAFIRGLPEELEESARLDGASTWTVFRRVVFPMMAPMSATVAIFAFLASWNDFMMPSLITADSTLQTLPVLQSVFQTQFSSNYNVAFASYLMAMAPAIVVYLFTQRWVMAGVTQGAIK
ncbi:carbohydrate ABC transporter permease [Cellulomonas oligotrophica]|uniref:ABC transporter permease n=1 Tax=Cellulomonas oligotrophica TaxID=931536 RepID=A0A7Y9FII3_9CELL|nr:carbohydrate ABC transporter permease [Cellulomonas oligotrophica]NYD87839.1 raffinose/stachyose/melibiose transport system permease protein [Cellulomonas oligotrophica]GIG32954.1 ABC transporter permease [Cellulomonas oligotrophica]